MEKIEVGEYVRTEKGEIIKIDGSWKYSTNNAGTILFINISKIPAEYYTRKIVNHSKNIIDLIEVGDYVNGEKIMTITNDRHLLLDRNVNLLDKYREIKSIVTKEQFAQMEYKVGE